MHAPQPSYGRPDDLKHFVQAAHERGLMVLIDVVYNHFGPEGNFLHRYPSAVCTATLIRCVASGVDWPVRSAGSAPATLK